MPPAPPAAIPPATRYAHKRARKNSTRRHQIQFRPPRPTRPRRHRIPAKRARSRAAHPPPLHQSLGNERAADERERGPDQLHDFNLIAPCVQPEPDDGGHCDGRRERQQKAQREPSAADRREARGDPDQPFAVIADVRDARQRLGVVQERVGAPIGLGRSAQVHLD